MSAQDSALSSVPPVRSFQFDSEALSDASNTINLFRGSVSLPLTLLSLAGPNGLDVSVQLSYDSGAAPLAQRWNVEAPTGMLGLGWSMPFETISAEGLATGDSPNDRYFMVSGGSAGRLLRIDDSAPNAVLFQAHDYKFWIISYDRSTETWHVTRDNGFTYIYGDSNSARHTVQWKVQWNNWEGSSVALGQHRYASTWNLSEIRSPWGDRVVFTYAEVEAAVGPNGLRYTKACYLDGIVDALGRTVDFVYGEKQFEPARGVCEYADPHKPIPSNVPDAYQSRYETRFLDAVRVLAADGSVQMAFRFEYDIKKFAKVAEGDPAYPYFAKRCLTGIVQANGQGQTLPGFQFAYYAERSGQPSPVIAGAMQSLVYPAGAVTSFEYSCLPLLGTGKSTTISAPVAGAVPRVWHGGDYIAVTWYASASHSLYLSVYTWNGRWVSWSFPQVIAADIAPDSLVLIPRPEFLVMTLRNKSASRDEFWMLRRDPSAYGQWTSQLQVAPLGAGAGNSVLASGDEFFAAYNASYSQFPMRGFNWSWQEQAWQNLPMPSIAVDASKSVQLAAVNNALVVASYDKAQKLGYFQTICRNAVGRWQTLSPWNASFDAALVRNQLAWVVQAVDSFLFLAFVSKVEDGTSPGKISYEIRNWRCNSRMQIQDPATPYVQTASVKLWNGKVNLAPLALHFDAVLLGNNARLQRYLGGGAPAWNGATLAASDANGASYNFAYGDNVALMSQSAGTALVNELLSYNPNTGIWASINLPARGTQPTISADIASIGSALYRRQNDNSWKPMVQGLQGKVVDQSVQNHAPNYISYQDLAGNVRVALIRNGKVAADEVVAQQQKNYVDTPQPGTILSGPGAFVSYPSATSFDKAAQLTLFQVAGDTVSQPLCDYPVTLVTVRDGYAGATPYARAFGYDQATCTYDAALSLAQYGHVRVAAGSRDVTKVPQGYTDYYYSNAYATQAGSFTGAGWPINYSRVLNGVLLAQVMYDQSSTEVCRTVNNFDVRTRVQTATGEWRQLAGAYFVPVLRQQIKDKVNNEVRLVYDYRTGQQTEMHSENYNSQGQLVKLRQVSRPASSIYPEMMALNMLTASAGDMRYVSIDGAPETLDAMKVSTWQRWPGSASNWAQQGTYEWRGSGSSEFLPAWWRGTAAPDANWLATSRTVERTARSAPAAIIDSNGTLSSSIYAQDGIKVVADFINASPDTCGAAFYSFEPYESSGQQWTWMPATAAALSTGDSRIGTCCLQAHASMTLRRSLAIQSPRTQYVVCAWVKTAPGYESGSAASWHFTLGAGAPLEHAIAATGGQWAFRTWLVTLPDGSGGNSIELALQVDIGAADHWIRIDAMAFFPLLSSFSARAFDTTTGVVIDQLGANGEVMSTFTDAFRRQIGTAGPGQVLASMSVQYLTRQDHVVGADQPFPVTAPNQQLAIGAQHGGLYSRFPDGSQGDWAFAGVVSGSWQLAGRALTFAGSSDGTVSPVGASATLAGFSASDIALRVRVEAAGSSSVAIGTGDYFVQWHSATGWQLLQVDAGQAQVLATSTALAHCAQDWLFMAIDGRLMVYADGIPLFNLYHAAARQNLGKVVLAAGSAARFSQLMVVAGPTLCMTFSDGDRKKRQTIQFKDAMSGVISATVYDVLYRPAIVALNSVISNANPYAYQAGYISNASADSALWQGQAMQGDIVALHPEAGGYPFNRTVYERSPLARVAQLGLAGIDLAVRPDNPHLRQFMYRCNLSDDGGKLPVGKYYVVEERNANGVATLTLSDKLGTPIRTRAGITGRGGVVMAEASFDYDASGLMVQAIPPNGGSGVGNVQMEYDYLKRQVAKHTPDNGRTRTMYNDGGQVRFTQTAAGAAANPPYIHYQKFDALGRLLETGTYPFDWTAQSAPELQAKATQDPAWPPAGKEWGQRHYYDQQGSDTSNRIGRVVRSETNNAGTAQADVVETITYTLTGKVATKSLWAGSFDNNTRTIAYGYDGSGEMTRIDYGNGEPATTYQLNRLGQVVAIGTEAVNDCYASYVYDANGNVSGECLNPATTAALQRQYHANAAGWPTRVADQNTSEVLQYISGGYQDAGYWDASVAQQVNSYPGLLQGEVLKFKNDALGRLAVSESTPTGGTPGVIQTYRYDASGNILAIATPTSTRTFTYEPGTNRLRNTNGSNDASFQYDANGNVTRSPLSSNDGMGLAYARANGAVRQITLADNSPIVYGYADRARRVQKTSAAAALLYVHGANEAPVLELETRARVTQSTVLIYGPTGLIVIKCGGDTYFMAKDHLGSIRAVTAANGALVAAYSYSPFGAVRSLIAGAPFFRYLFTGQELDPETGLYNFRLRLYDPVIGRFYMIDPAGQEPSPYSYVANAPLRFIDISGADFGLSLLVAVLVTALIGAAVSGIAYAIVNRDHFVWKDFGIAIGVGALAGGIAGGVGFAGPALLAAGATTLGAASVAQSATFSIVAGAAFGSGGAVLGQVVANAVTGQELSQGLGMAALTGAIVGGIGGYVGWRMNVGKQVGLHGTSSNYVQAITRRIDPPMPGANFGGAQLGEGFYTSVQRPTANYFANASVVNNGGNPSYLRIFSRSYSPASDVNVPNGQQWGPLPWAADPIRAAYITNFDTVSGPVAGIAGAVQIKFNPRTYSNLWAFPEQPTGIWRYLSW